MRNNAAGQAWGHAHEAELTAGTLRSALDRACGTAVELWDAGELARSSP
jgi:hypothetical protein